MPVNAFQRRYFARMLRVPSPRVSEKVPTVERCGAVCLLCRYGSEADMLQQWEWFRNFHSNFQVVLYYEGKPYQGLIFNKLDVHPFAASHFGLFGRVPAEVVSRLQSQSYDILVNTIEDMDDRMAMVHRWIRADFKIGRDASYAYLNDLSLRMAPGADTQAYLKTVKEYLNTLNG
ncbi:MAG: hypothetical protein J5873_02980 [Bacteroidales bacterium]|nr:hypothetical protein [Bacteroidales bacterium]